MTFACAKRPMSLVLAVLFCSQVPALSQKFLRITSVRFGKVKVTEIGNHSIVRYREKGSLFGKRAEIGDMRDSTIYFLDGTALALARLGGIGVRSEAHFPRVLQRFFFYGGVGLIPLSALNSVIAREPVALTPGLVYVSASALTAGCVTLWLRNKRIHTGKRKAVQIMERDNGG